MGIRKRRLQRLRPWWKVLSHKRSSLKDPLQIVVLKHGVRDQINVPELILNLSELRYLKRRSHYRLQIGSKLFKPRKRLWKLSIGVARGSFSTSYWSMTPARVAFINWLFDSDLELPVRGTFSARTECTCIHDFFKHVLASMYSDTVSYIEYLSVIYISP